jgi:hypothetical protein
MHRPAVALDEPRPQRAEGEIDARRHRPDCTLCAVEPAAWNDLHDWEIVSVSSEPPEQRLTLAIQFPKRNGGADRAELVFEHVIGHFLEGELRQNVSSEVRELPVGAVLSAYAFLFRRERSSGWPLTSSDDADLSHKLAERGARAFEISSSVGLAGFVLARTVDVRAADRSA